MARKKYSEKYIIKGCIRGNEKCYRFLFKQYYTTMYYTCRRYCLSDYDAQEMVQQGFILIFENIRKFKHKGSFEGWMKHIMINNTINHYRKQKRHIEKATLQDTLNTQLQDNQYDVISKLSAEEILYQVNRLPFLYRNVFKLYVIHGYSHKEIAKILNMQESSSRSALTRAKDKLRMILHRELNIYAYAV